MVFFVRMRQEDKKYETKRRTKDKRDREIMQRRKKKLYVTGRKRRRDERDRN